MRRRTFTPLDKTRKLRKPYLCVFRQQSVKNKNVLTTNLLYIKPSKSVLFLISLSLFSPPFFTLLHSRSLIVYIVLVIFPSVYNSLGQNCPHFYTLLFLNSFLLQTVRGRYYFALSTYPSPCTLNVCALSNLSLIHI